jgi:SAM-dependent methyltransferase
MLKTEAYSCPFCEGASSFYVEAFGDPLWKCRACGLVFLSPHPSQEEMIRRHQSKEYADHPYFLAGERAAQEEGIGSHQLLLDKLRSQLPKGARVLDVGAGSGDVLKLLSNEFQVEGIEPSTYLADRIRARVDCPLFVGPFEDFHPEHRFDAVLFVDIIEHAADPRVLLEKAYSVLRPGGLVFISTLDSGSLLYRLGPLVGKLARALPIARYVLHRIFCRQHNWYFNKRVLRELVAGTGFQVFEQQGFEFPLNRLNEKPILVAGLRAVYLLQHILGSKTEQYLQGRKNAA